jgi:hypothetical protein
MTCAALLHTQQIGNISGWPAFAYEAGQTSAVELVFSLSGPLQCEDPKC